MNINKFKKIEAYNALIEDLILQQIEFKIKAYYTRIAIKTLEKNEIFMFIFGGLSPRLVCSDIRCHSL